MPFIDKGKEKQMHKGTVTEFMRVQKAMLTGSWMINLIEEKVTLAEETYRIFGIDKDKFDKTIKSFMKYIHKDDVGPVKEFIKKVMETKVSDYFEIEFRITRPDGSVRFLSHLIRTNFDDSGRLHLVNGTASDVTERKLSEKELKESEGRYRSIFECSLAMLITVDNDRKITGFNPEAYNKFGYKPEEIINKDISILYKDPDEAKKVSHGLMENGKFVGRVKNVRKNGDVFEAQLSASILYDVEGNKIGTVGSSLEIK